MWASVNEWHAHTEFVKSILTFFKTPYKSPGHLFFFSTRVLSPSHCLFFFFFLSLKQWLEFKEESLWTSQDDKTGIFWCAAQLNQCQLCLQPRQRVGVAFHIIWARAAFEAARLRFVNNNRGRKVCWQRPNIFRGLCYPSADWLTDTVHAEQAAENRFNTFCDDLCGNRFPGLLQWNAPLNVKTA